MDEIVFSEEEIDEINSWLTAADYPTLLHIYDDFDEDLSMVFNKYDYFGIFTDIESHSESGQIVGLTATFTTNAPFAWSEEYHQSFTIVGEGAISLNVHTSERKREIYPKIEISPSIGGSVARVNISITNHSDNNKTLSMSVVKDKITIDSEYSTIKDEYANLLSFEDLGIDDVGEIYWPRLYYGRNLLTLVGSGTYTFTWREPRKVGAY